jgi:hypothetical protein
VAKAKGNHARLQHVDERNTFRLQLDIEHSLAVASFAVRSRDGMIDLRSGLVRLLDIRRLEQIVSYKRAEAAFAG